MRAGAGRAAASAVTERRRSRAAVAVILRKGPRGHRDAVHPARRASAGSLVGPDGFPGGRAEPGDADLRATAVRETLEEIGIDLAAEAELLGGLDEMRAMARMRPMDLAIAPFVFRLHEARDRAQR